MSFRFMPPKDTANTYSYVSSFMSMGQYLDKLGEVQIVIPENQTKEGAFPDIYLPSTTGEMISIAECAKDKNVVLFFYPGDKEGIKYPELAGCTPEACSFRDAISDFAKLNTQVFGVSFQTSQRQNQLVKEKDLNFCLLSDAEQLLSKSLKLPYWKSKQGELYPCRQTYIITKGNEISNVFDKVEPNGHIDEVLREINKLENSLKLK